MAQIWLIGAGEMAQEYIKVLEALKTSFMVIGRGEESAKRCKEATGCEVQYGGLENFLRNKPMKCSHAIVSVGVEKLCETTMALLEYGIQNILVEKPGALYQSEFEKLLKVSNDKQAKILIAYNRRFYASVNKAHEMIKRDGGVTSFNFEFTEWSHVIEPLKKADGVKERWFLGNSTHVVDLAFFLGGKPEEMCCFVEGGVEWHPSSSVFSGAGKSDRGALFSYHANWESAGRWSVEILTKAHKLILRPMEKLQIQKRGTISQEFDEAIDYSLDEEFKPGLYLQTKKFLENDTSKMCTLKEQYERFPIYNKIAGYEAQ